MTQVNRLAEDRLSGDVILSISYKDPWWWLNWPPWDHLEQAALNRVIDAIRGHQHRRYPDAPKLWTLPTHARLYLRPDKIVDVTWPKAKWSTIDEIVAKDEHNIVVRFKGHRFNHGDVLRMIEIARPYIGKRYDLLDLGQFLACEKAGVGYEGKTAQEICDTIGGGKDNEVCSIGVAIVLNTRLEEIGIHRPLHCITDLTAPASFLCAEKDYLQKDHPFEVVYEHRPDSIPRWARRLTNAA